MINVSKTGNTKSFSIYRMSHDITDLSILLRSVDELREI